MKINKKILGKNIYLKSLSLKNVTENYLRWLQDKEVNHFLETRHEKQSLKKIKNYVNLCNKSDNIYLFGIFTKSDIHVGNIKLGPIKKNHSIAPISIFLGNKKYWGKGIGPDAINALADFSFNDLNLNKVIAGMYSKNKNSIKAFENVGFVKEGIRKKHYKLESNFIDIIELGLLSEEYKK